MADKPNSDGQPTIEKLTSEGVPLRKCIAMGGDYGNGGSKPTKANPVLGSVKMGKGGY